MNIIENLEKLLASGQDNAILRYGLGNAYLQQNNVEQAIIHLEKALQFNPDYSAAWKLYAKSLSLAGKTSAAISAYEKGIIVAEKNGDKQAAKEMRVFLKRLQ